MSSVKSLEPEHHYRFEMRGASTWRFDEGTGEACMITSSQAEAGLWATMRCPARSPSGSPPGFIPDPASSRNR